MRERQMSSRGIGDLVKGCRGGLHECEVRDDLLERALVWLIRGEARGDRVGEGSKSLPWLGTR
jgi:hypothetical protein